MKQTQREIFITANHSWEVIVFENKARVYIQNLQGVFYRVFDKIEEVRNFLNGRKTSFLLETTSEKKLETFLEDFELLQEAKKANEEFKKSGEKVIPYEKVLEKALVKDIKQTIEDIKEELAKIGTYDSKTFNTLSTFLLNLQENNK